MPAYDKRQLLKSAYNYAQAGQWDRALDEYRRVAKLFPEDPNVHSMIADLLVKKNDPAGAAASHLEAAKLHKEQANDDKELQALKRALKVQAGSAEAASRMESFFSRALAKASSLSASGKLKEAEEAAQKLLDADPGHLAVNRLIDDIRGKRLQEEAVLAFQEEERLAASQSPALDATKEVMDRLRNTAEGYLASEDFDNAIETMLIMLKIDPAAHGLREQMERAQEQLKKKKKAQDVWQSILSKESEAVSEVKEREVSAKEMAEWAAQEAAVRERLALELESHEETARQELEIIEKAVKEIRSNAAPSGPGAAAVSAADETRLRALELEKRNLEERLARERDEAVAHQRQMMEEVRLENEKLKHAIELERMEAEAKARSEALKEIDKQLESERKTYETMLLEERARSAKAEEAMRAQMQDLMRQEMAKLRSEMQGQAMDDMKSRLDEERRRRLEMEREMAEREAAAVAKYQDEQRRLVEARSNAEDRVRKEREAIITLKVQEEARKAAALEEAMKRRSARTGSAAVEERQAVLKTSRRISDALHAAATKHLETDLDGMLETAKRYLAQDLLLDAMRICQKITAMDPQNEKVKAVLKEIYVKKGL